MSDIETGQRKESMGDALIARSGELAISAAAARAKAEAEAGYIVAIKNPRNIYQARTEILEACKRPRFAESARFHKKVGGTVIVGPSIRFAEVAIQAMGNVRSSSTITYEDEQIRCLHISVTDYEKNIAYGKDVTLTKTVERKSNKDRVVISERVNSYNEKVYVVVATEDEMQNKSSAAESKIIRNSGLRLVPQDIIDEAMEQCVATIAGESSGDPGAYRKRWVDAFGKIGVSAAALEKYLGHKIEDTTADEWADLAGIHAAIKNKESKWSDYTEGKPQPERGTLKPEDLKATTKEDPPIDVIPGPSLSDTWKQFVLDLKRKKVSKEGLARADELLAEQYGTSDLSTLPPEIAPTEIIFEGFLKDCTRTLEEEEWLK